MAGTFDFFFFFILEGGVGRARLRVELGVRKRKVGSSRNGDEISSCQHSDKETRTKGHVAFQSISIQYTASRDCAGIRMAVRGGSKCVVMGTPPIHTEPRMTRQSGNLGRLEKADGGVSRQKGALGRWGRRIDRNRGAMRAAERQREKEGERARGDTARTGGAGKEAAVVVSWWGRRKAAKF